MKISNVQIKNFKSIFYENLDLDQLAIFVGANGTGKSNFLKALEYFYNPKIFADKDDFYNRNVDSPIEIRVTYSDLNDDEIDHFGKYVSVTKELVVIKRFNSFGTSGKYYGVSLGCKDFVDLPRKPVADFKKAFNELRKQKKYEDLKSGQSAGALEESLKDWEEKNASKLELVESENQFFGFENSSASSLEKFTKFVYIPAVLYESHLEDTKNSPIGDLTDILARQKLKEDDEIKALQEEISKKYLEKLKPFNVGEMAELSTGLTGTLKNYYDDAKVRIQLDEEVPDIKLPVPKAEIRVQEGQYETIISAAGQGLQRAFILSLLQYFAENKNESSEGDSFNLILGIDEPELYQHPSKQKLFRKVLKSLTTSASGVLGASAQCLYTTHSPLMLTIEDFSEVIRVFKVFGEENKASETKLKRSSLDELARKEADLPSRGEVFTDLKTLSSMVNAIDSRVNEGFFSGLLVLVEGESDLVALKTAAKYHSKGSIDLDVLDIPIISCNGKSNLEKPALIFSLMGIPTYTIWDSDKSLVERLSKLQKQHDEASGQEKINKKAKLDGCKSTVDKSISKNKDLLYLNSLEPKDWPKGVFKTCAAFENDLESMLMEELGREYLLGLVTKHNRSIQAKNAWKNPIVMSSVLNEAFSGNNKSETLEKIISAILELKKDSK